MEGLRPHTHGERTRLIDQLVDPQLAGVGLEPHDEQLGRRPVPAA